MSTYLNFKLYDYTVVIWRDDDVTSESGYVEVALYDKNGTQISFAPVSDAHKLQLLKMVLS